MREALFVLTFVSLICLKVAGQINLTKQEVINAYTSATSRGSKSDTIMFSYDLQLEMRIRHFTDSMQSNGIDSLIVYVESLPGYISSDHCFKYMYPEYAYVFWKSAGKLIIRKIVGECEFKASTSDSNSIFSFWIDNQESIDHDIVMPVILGAEKTEEKIITYTINTISHEPKYSILLIAGKDHRKIKFDQNSITNTDGMFYKDNLQTKSVQLWQTIDEQIKRSNFY